MMHIDGGPEHYMRYFIVADPVGRILGYVKRGYVAPGPGVVVSTDPIPVRALTEVERLKEGYVIDSDYVARINDCPYIQIFTEDVFDALAKNTIHLV
jgi:hypothetical protein